MLKDKDVFVDPDERKNDRNFDEYSPYSILHLPIDRIPSDIQRMMIKVFGKHKPFEVREWATKLMQSYQLLHAIEKPMNL